MDSNPKDDLSTTTIFRWEGSIGYLPRRVYIYLSNPSIKEKTEDRFLSPLSIEMSWTKRIRMIRTLTKVGSKSFPEQGAYRAYEIEGIIDLTA